jgi:uncharacterized protein YhaN
MAKVDDVLKSMILRHGKRIAKEVVGELLDQMKQARRDIRAIQKAVADLTKRVERLVEQRRAETY